MLHEMIQRKLIDYARTGVFYKMRYDPVTQLPDLVTQDTETVAPTSVRTNETDERFSIDERTGLAERLKQDDWTFSLLMSFPCEVSVEAFKYDLMQNIFTIHLGELSATIVLSRISAKHPIQSQSTNGTEANVVFRVILGRV